MLTLYANASKVKQSVKAPILLFNEADAIIGKRQVGAERAVEQMENSIQNIILQEIEQLDGILIATTNLAENIARHFTIQSILHGQPENMVKSLVEFCENERLEGSRTKRKIGF